MEDFRNLNWSWYTIRTGKDSLQYFDKTFIVDESDIFYCHLNEIEPHLLSEKDANSENESDLIPIDPRTKKIVNEIFIDNSKLHKNHENIQVFKKFKTRSILSKKEHQTGLLALQTLIERKEVPLQNVVPQKIKKEMRLFNEFVRDYMATNPERNNILRKFLIEKYMVFLEFQANRILAQPNTFYSLQTAIPFDEANQICNFIKSEVTQHDGIVPELNCFEFSKIMKNCHLPLAHLQNESAFTGESIQLNENIDVVIPENALHLLLSSNTLSDTWEIPLKIDTFENNRGKLIWFDEPLPLRSQREYICTRLFENLIAYEMQSDKCTKWFSLKDNTYLENSNSEVIEMDISAINLEMDYKLFECDDYLKQCTNETSETKPKKSNRILCKWGIAKENENQINLLTQTQANFIESDENGVPVFTNMSIKLEYKAEFGAEVMTKGELIQEWLRQYLLSSGITKRVRIDVRTSKTILIQNMCLADIELELMRLYSVRPCDILGSFHSLLSVISNFPIGDYLLKFNPKYNNKLLVYTKTEKSAQNGLSSHELYENVRNKIDLLIASEYIPIDGNTITPMHQFHTLLPSCFPHWTGARTQYQPNSNRKSRINKKTKVNNKAKKFNKKKKNKPRIGTDNINS